jgi:hypothetical protein
VKTIYDLVTLVLFAGLAILFLQRSTQQPSEDRMLHYLPPAVGCALANWLGNNGQPVWGAVVLALGVAYTIYVLKPFKQNS